MNAELAVSMRIRVALLVIAGLSGTVAGLRAAGSERLLAARFADSTQAAIENGQVVALVGDSVIGRDELERALVAVDSDRRARIDEAVRDHVLSRLIDEELLLQAAIDIGLEAEDGAVRRVMIDAMIAAIEAQADDRTVDLAVRDYLDWLRSERAVWSR